MKVVTGLRALAAPPRRAVVTIGMFDGVHVGHQRLIRTTVRWARRLHGTSVVMTFHPDPQQVLEPRRARPPLMPLDGRIRRIAELGADLTWIIRFTHRFSTITADAFLRDLLIRRLRARCVVVGSNFGFGKDRQGTLALLQAFGQRHGIRIVVVPPVRRGGEPVSSSRVRRVIQAGRVDEAGRLLGRPVELRGVVVHGAGRGRQLGFPTANVRLAAQWRPPTGVYRVWLDAGGRRRKGLMNLGYRPTFGPGPLTCEVFLLGPSPRLYGRPVTIGVLERIRDERRFTSPRALIEQIRRDLVRAGFKKSAALLSL